MIVNNITSNQPKTQSTGTVSSNQNDNPLALEVDALANNSNAYLDKNINLRGVVSFVYPESNTLVIIDNKEFANCGVVTCAINQIPVSYSGQMPKVKDFIVASGILKTMANRKLIFEATRLTPQ